MSSQSFGFPDVLRADSGIALVWPLYVGSQAQQRIEATAILAPYREGPLPEGLLSISVFLSTDGETLLTYAQWTSDEAYRRFESRSDIHSAPGRVQPIRYIPYRSTVLDPNGTLHSSRAHCLVAPTFDVDGPERQKRSVDALIDGPLSRPVPGLIASHFHISLDGSRVLNWAEWSDEEAHETFMRSSVPAAFREAITIPGVRGMGGKRYALGESVIA